MLFILPYVKPINTTESPGNIEEPPNPSESQVSLEVEETTANSHEDETSLASSEVIFTNNSEREDSVPTTSKTAKIPQYTTATRKKNMHDNVDKSFLEYLQNKKQKLAPTDEKETARKYFLLSLLPDIKTLTDDQMRHFQIEVLHLLENIKKNSGPPTITTPLSSTGSNNYPYSSARSVSRSSHHSFEGANEISSANNGPFGNFTQAQIGMTSPTNEYEREQQSDIDQTFWKQL